MTETAVEQIHAAPTAGSEAGAERVAPIAGKLADQILEALRQVGAHGLTNGELTAILKGRDVTIWPRVSSLRERGKLKDSGRTRPSPETGTAMTVWVLTTAEEEERIQAERKARESALIEPPGREAKAAAERIRGEWDTGALFRTQEHLERVVQEAINARLRRLSRAALKAERRALARLKAEQNGGRR